MCDPSRPTRRPRIPGLDAAMIEVLRRNTPIDSVVSAETREIGRLNKSPLSPVTSDQT